MLYGVFNRTLRTQNNSQSVTDGKPQCMKEERKKEIYYSGRYKRLFI
jgi:hypothetical protein